MRIVLDTNVWVSGLLWRGAPWCVLRLAEEGKVEVWATGAILQEIQQTLHYPRLQPRRQKLGLEIAELMAYAYTLVALVEVVEVAAVIADDPDDDVILACAVSASAAYIVSGDRHLLKQKEHQGIIIVQPDEFLARMFPTSTDAPTAEAGGE